MIGIAGVLVTNSTMVSLHVAYLQDLDFYSLALFLAVLSVWILVKKDVGRMKWLRYVLACLCMIASLAIYQAFICVMLMLILGVCMMKLLSSTKPGDMKANVIFMLKAAAVLVISLLIYYAVWKLAQKVFGVWTSDSYNGLNSVGDYSSASIGGLIVDTYSKVLMYFVHPDLFVSGTLSGRELNVVWLWVLRLANCGILTFGVGSLIYLNIRRKTGICSRVVQFVFIVLSPFMANFVNFLSKGMEHDLMIYAFSLFYVGAFIVTGLALSDSKRKGIRVLAILFAAVLLWSNVVYANQAYFKKSLQDKSAASLLTRMVAQIEQTPGYRFGETPVAFAGSFTLSDYVRDIPYFEEVVPMGMGITALTYKGTPESYIGNILNVNMEFTNIDESIQEVRDMPCYPEDGSVAFIGDVLGVKLSELIGE